MALQICPLCEVGMEVKVREDVMIDMCPSCRGVWLDRGELEKIIADVRREESSSNQDAEQSSFEVRRDRQESKPDKKHKDEKYDKKKHKEEKKKKKKKRSSFFDLIEDVLDFD
ncbi:MAG: zf-TFIIB domain-containing protein [Planctomycetota bacterium]